MKKTFAILAVFGLGVAFGQIFDGVPPRAEAGGGNPLPSCQDINGDGASDVTDAINFLQWLFQGGPEPTCPAGNGLVGLPDTGQTKCYDAAAAETPCDSATCRGQDGSYASGCPSEGRFTDNGDGTVTDQCTGLMWQKLNGNDGIGLNWCSALDYCENLELAGHDDWRLPNMRELESLVDYGRFAPAIHSIFSALSAVYWSSTSSAGNRNYAWYVYFFDGDVGQEDKDMALYVRAVRSGP